ncbi:glutathionylspermidine synthase family protein [Acinetobacter baumannii]
MVLIILIYLLSDGSIYWSEGVAREFTFKQIEQLEDAANELHQMCLSVVGDLIQRGLPSYFQIPETAISHIEHSWKQNAPMLYGRFDFAYDGRNIKMLEYNADTPTGLLEASCRTVAVDRTSLGHCKPETQFNIS